MFLDEITPAEIRAAAKQGWETAGRLYNNALTDPAKAADAKRLGAATVALNNLFTVAGTAEFLVEALKARQARSRDEKRRADFEASKGHLWSTLPNGFQVYLKADGSYSLIDSNVDITAGPYRGFAQRETNRAGADGWRVEVRNSPATMADYTIRRRFLKSEDGAVRLLERWAVELNPPKAA